MNSNTTFPGFEHPSDKLVKFIVTADIYSILLIDGSVVHFVPKDNALFQMWLINNYIENIKVT